MTLQEKIERLFTQTEFDAGDHETFNKFKTAPQCENFSDLISINLHCFVARRLLRNPNLMKKAEMNLNN
ncbi:MAG: hypothetical protein ACR2GD_07715 [Pyrinomonadaceae bacterium]